MNVGRFGRVGRFGVVGRWAGRLLVALALVLAPVTPLAQPASALVCEMKPTRVGWRCFCRGAYGWRIAPAIMCRVSR